LDQCIDHDAARFDPVAKTLAVRPRGDHDHAFAGCEAVHHEPFERVEQLDIVVVELKKMFAGGNFTPEDSWQLAERANRGYAVHVRSFLTSFLSRLG
jgi:hypothetical protein